MQKNEPQKRVMKKRAKDAPADEPLEFKSAVMQRIQDLVRGGYHRYTCGVISTSRLPALRAKFAARYTTDASRAERQRRRRNGLANAWLIVHRPPKAIRAVWWLLVEDGDHLAHSTESLRDARDRPDRLIMPDPGIGRKNAFAEVERAFELVKLDDRWTWRMSSEMKTAWRDRIRSAARTKDTEKGDEEWRQAMWSLRRMPGFRGIRSDAYDLVKLARHEWKRNRSGPPVALPKLPGWTCRLPHV